jgi:osmotically-inducible protein OsmY
MRRHIAFAAVAGSVALLTLAACDRESATQARNEAERLGQKVDQALDRTQEKLAAAGDRLQPKLEAAGERIASAGEQVAATVTTGPRTSVSGIPESTRASLGDAAITASIKTDFLKDPDLSVLKIDVDTKDGVVTLNGLAENEAARGRAEQLAGAIKGVREVRNHLTVKRG